MRRDISLCWNQAQVYEAATTILIVDDDNDTTIHCERALCQALCKMRPLPYLILIHKNSENELLL